MNGVWLVLRFLSSKEIQSFGSSNTYIRVFPVGVYLVGSRQRFGFVLLLPRGCEVGVH